MNVVEYFEKRTHKTTEKCPICNNYLNIVDGLYNYGDYFECPDCGYIITVKEYYGKEIDEEIADMLDQSFFY